MTVNNKIANIYSLQYIYLSSCEINNIPGSEKISVKGEWKPIKFASIEYTEKQDEQGGEWEQNFSAVITEFNTIIEKELYSIKNNAILLRLDYSNHISKIVGTDEYPVILSLSNASSSHTYTLSFKRNSPEAAKFLQSF
ncbi:MAG: hypothetical protein H6Q12_48 [Bacteroidetes bacterium]|nr:hypothetical protein [Bacteroidota bacterium]